MCRVEPTIFLELFVIPQQIVWRNPGAGTRCQDWPGQAFHGDCVSDIMFDNDVT